MSKQWERGCLRIELAEPTEDCHPLEDRRAKVFIHVLDEEQEEREVLSEGELGIQLAHLLHACMVLSSGEDEEWFVPNPGHPLHMRRHGHQVEIARYPAYASHSTAWLTDDGLYLVNFGMLLESLSAAVEWIVSELDAEFAQDDMVQVLIHQWERAWQRFSRLATFRRVELFAYV